eukprot:gnl/TRDRNA2_/TRDRNA2_143583_c0_seq1.p1 gnl/TRDRNA2_/TRDRNA2_143583_c0~~gnl/TRDRNA2_/TRDRNA2_143583_c0_seq1.p1  ORF type:complete len:269 (+),score=38.58 gnl/TRDRNA2_/TRDRNA2_143583_c0_seq1:84-809(+)
MGLGDVLQVLGTSPDSITVDDLASGKAAVGAIVAEPFFYDSKLPWHGLACWHITAALRRSGLLMSDAKVMPRRAKLVAMLVMFAEGLDGKRPVQSAAGFDHAVLDKLTMSQRGRPQLLALWQHTHQVVSERHVLLDFDLKTEPHDRVAMVNLLLPHSDNAHSTAATPNALVSWLDYQLDEHGLLLVHGAPTDTAEPSHHLVAAQYINSDEFPAGTKSITVQAAFQAADCEVTLDIIAHELD